MKVPTATRPLIWNDIIGDTTLLAYETLYTEGKLNIISLLDELSKIAGGYTDFVFKNLQFSVRIEDSENPKFYMIIEPEEGNRFTITMFNGKKSLKLRLNRILSSICKIMAARRASRNNIPNTPVGTATYNLHLTGPSDPTNLFKLLAWIEDCGVKNISSTIELTCDGTRVKWSLRGNKESINAKTCEEIVL